MLWKKPHFFMFWVSKEARLSCNVLKWSWEIMFKVLKVFQFLFGHYLLFPPRGMSFFLLFLHPLNTDLWINTSVIRHQTQGMNKELFLKIADILVKKQFYFRCFISSSLSPKHLFLFFLVESMDLHSLKGINWYFF